MTERPTDRQPPPASLNLGDVYYVLFRRKWLILGGSFLGMLVALAIYLGLPTAYVSEAKLAVRYVVETKSLPSANRESGDVKPTDSGGDSIINSELEILKSMDLALEVATNIGPDKILAKAGGGTNPIAAANLIASGLTVGHPKLSMIINVQFRHPDPALVQPVLTGLIQSYRSKHAEVHRPGGVVDDFLQQQTDKLRLSLQQDEDDLRRAKTNAGIISVEDTRRDLNARITKIQDTIFSAQAELAQRQAALGEVQKLVSVASDTATNELAAPPGKLNQYKRIRARLDALQNREDDLLIRFTDENPVVKGVRQEINDAEKQKEELEAEYPNLASLSIASSGSGAQPFDPAAEMARVKGLGIMINVLSNQLGSVRSEAEKLDEAGVGIIQLQRQRDLDEANFRSYLAALDQARVYEAMGPGRVSNIITAQEPSPPMIDTSRKPKAVLMALAAGVLGSIALAFLLELFLDPRIKRSGDVEKKLRLPLFLVIPEVKKNGHARLPDKNLEPSGGSGPPAEVAPEPAVALHPLANGLTPYYEALRDRLMFFFHARNMTHKPKLVGITSCSRAAGATTVAAGLAAALSETGEGNVLLVDMNLPGGAAHPFYKGRAGCGLQELLEGEKRSEAFVQENLYLASAVQPSGRNAGLLPRRFSDLMPKLKASDYDFIIFDLPPVSQTSATANLAGMLDMTFLVLESEKTHREAAARAAATFAESRANVAAVLNKARAYVPSWLHPEF